MRDSAFVYAEGKDHSGQGGDGEAAGLSAWYQNLKLYTPGTVLTAWDKRTGPRSQDRRGLRAQNQSREDRDLPEQGRKETRTDVQPEDNLCLHSPAAEKGTSGERGGLRSREKGGKDEC